LRVGATAAGRSFATGCNQHQRSESQPEISPHILLYLLFCVWRLWVLRCRAAGTDCMDL